MNRRRSFYLISGAAATGFPKENTRAQNGSFEQLARQFMADYEVPGLSVAFASRGQIIRREAFGVADKAGKALTTEHQFRIASISKPITAAAIFTLLEERKVNFRSKVFGPDGLLPYNGPRDINLMHLLTHTTGGWPNKKGDPMFQKRELNHRQLIEWTLKEYPLTGRVGSTYAYSNFGYCLLGRIIEATTGRVYESYVKETILRPCGINTMHIGPDQPGRNEVQYYDQNGEVVTYPLLMWRMDSHGGWVGSPTDLVKFGLCMDGLSDPPELLKEDSLKAMTYFGGVHKGYGCGWNINEHGNYWHNGSLPGLTSILVCTSAGDVWAACANTRRDGIGLALDKLLWKMRGAI